MDKTRFSPILAASTAVAMAALLTACSPDAVSGDDPEQAPEAANTADTDAQENAAAGGGLDTLYANSLHDGVTAAAAGTAYIEIKAERLDSSGIECDIGDREGSQALQFTVEGETAYGTTELRLLRGIGWVVGFDYEEELVQVTHLGGTGGRGEFSDISMAQNSDDEGGGIDWSRGGRPDPMVRIVGSDVTAIGTISGTPGSGNPQEGAFVMAANCG